MTSTRRLRATLLATLVGVAVVAGCGGPRDVTALDRSLAVTEGYFQCDVSRSAYGELQAIESQLDDALSEAGASSDDYRSFKDLLGDSAELRGLVSAAYETRCGTS